MWSRRVPETTLPSSYSARAKFSLISLQNSAARLHEVTNSSRVGEKTRGKGSELSHLVRQGNPGRREIFFSCKHLVSPTRDNTTRTENACACYNQSPFVLQLFLSCRTPLCRIFNLARPNKGQQMSNFIQMLRRVVSREGCLGYPRPYKWGLTYVTKTGTS